ncbi:S-adenosyl-L-methionine-dependent methyltransferase [Halteromyces radiatus]|uniref:S-adenosyl-L-methionine-dependent methyltransferase n=1 Tax=Halteromyces radiatus TaxID=101107 RepID=UPI0022207D20|nr:S-adenosyl-L-methionine-dependent methyltransferase [Halteromyces radiatus]KAI8093619.1 S-adenosyl-L-methionine-dependent methyltransferase [Halteromyces radiatus]
MTSIPSTINVSTPSPTTTSITSFFKSKWRSSTRDLKPWKPIPNTRDHIERSWVQHNALQIAFEGDYMAPMKQALLSGGCEVLDIGCGAGFWSMDMATKYPLSYFIGIDVDKNVFPNITMQKNLIFQRVDIMTTPLPYDNNTFDYIFIRSMLDTLPDDDWDRVLQDIVRIMKKGAYLECIEPYTNLFDTGPAMSTITKLVNTSSSLRLLSTQSSSNIPANMNPWPNRLAFLDTLKNMQIHHTHTPIGKHGGALGSLMVQYWERIIKASRQDWIQSKTISEKELESVHHELLEEVETQQTYMAWYSVVAQKKGYKGPAIVIEDYDDQTSIMQ